MMKAWQILKPSKIKIALFIALVSIMLCLLYSVAIFLSLGRAVVALALRLAARAPIHTPAFSFLVIPAATD